MVLKYPLATVKWTKLVLEVDRVNVVKDREKGFTMIELILVLSIVTIMSAIIIPIGDKWIRTTAEEDAITSLIVTIHSLQSYAMANKVYTRLSFRSEGSRTQYIAAAPGKVELSRKLLPEGMYVLGSSKLKVVEFHSTGNIINSGTLTLGSKLGITTFTFQFERGRMIISESKRIFMAGSNTRSNRHPNRIWYTASARNENDFDPVRQKVEYVRC